MGNVLLGLLIFVLLGIAVIKRQYVFRPLATWETVVLIGLLIFPVGTVQLTALPFLVKFFFGIALTAVVWLKPSFWVFFASVYVVRHMMTQVITQLMMSLP
jgi:hypothetical protein